MGSWTDYLTTPSPSKPVTPAPTVTPSSIPRNVTSPTQSAVPFDRARLTPTTPTPPPPPSSTPGWLQAIQGVANKIEQPISLFSLDSFVNPYRKKTQTNLTTAINAPMNALMEAAYHGGSPDENMRLARERLGITSNYNDPRLIPGPGAGQGRIILSGGPGQPSLTTGDVNVAAGNIGRGLTDVAIQTLHDPLTLTTLGASAVGRLGKAALEQPRVAAAASAVRNNPLVTVTEDALKWGAPIGRQYGGSMRQSVRGAANVSSSEEARMKQYFVQRFKDIQTKYKLSDADKVEIGKALNGETDPRLLPANLKQPYQSYRILTEMDYKIRNRAAREQLGAMGQMQSEQSLRASNARQPGPAVYSMMTHEDAIDMFLNGAKPGRTPVEGSLIKPVGSETGWNVEGINEGPQFVPGFKAPTASPLLQEPGNVTGKTPTKGSLIEFRGNVAAPDYQFQPHVSNRPSPRTISQEGIAEYDAGVSMRRARDYGVMGLHPFNLTPESVESITIPRFELTPELYDKLEKQVPGYDVKNVGNFQVKITRPPLQPGVREDMLPRFETYFPGVHEAEEAAKGRPKTLIDLMTPFDPRALPREPFRITTAQQFDQGLQKMAENAGRQFGSAQLIHALQNIGAYDLPEVRAVFQKTIPATGDARTAAEKIYDVWKSIVGLPRKAVTSGLPIHALNVATIFSANAPEELPNLFALTTKLLSAKSQSEYDRIVADARRMGALSGDVTEKQPAFANVPLIGHWTTGVNKVVWAVDDAAKTLLARKYQRQGMPSLEAGGRASGRMVDYQNVAPIVNNLRGVAPFATFRSGIPGAILGATARNPQKVAAISRLTGGLATGDVLQNDENRSLEFLGPMADVGRATGNFGVPGQTLIDSILQGTKSYARSSLADPVKAGITLLSEPSGSKTTPTSPQIVATEVRRAIQNKDLSALLDTKAAEEEDLSDLIASFPRRKQFSRSIAAKAAEQAERYMTYGNPIDLRWLLNASVAGVPQAQAILNNLGAGEFQGSGPLSEFARQGFNVQIR